VAVTGTGFPQTLEQILSFLYNGHSVFEIVKKVVPGDLTYEDPETGESVDESHGPLVTWHKLAQRMPQTIFRWHQYDGDLLAVDQRVWKNESFETIRIPGEDLIVFTLKREGDDFTGQSILRHAYKAWLMKETVEKIAVMAVERHGVGIPVAYPSQAAELNDAIMDRLEDIMANLRAGDSVYVVMPGPKQTSGQDGYMVEILAPPGGVPDFTPLLEYLRAEIKAAVLARFSELGHGKTGARATGDTQSKIWQDALHVVARFIANVLEQGLRRLSLENFPAPSQWPTILVEDIEADDLVAFAAAQAQLCDSGAVIPDKPYRQYVRRTIDAPREADTTSGPADHGFAVDQGVLVGPDGAPTPTNAAVDQVTGQRAEQSAQIQAKYAPKPTAPPGKSGPPGK
jgi:hypothetical protein